MLKKRLSIVVILIAAISILVCSSLVFAETSVPVNNQESINLTKLFGSEIDVSDLDNYFNSKNLSSYDTDESIRVIVKVNSSEKAEAITNDLNALNIDVTKHYTYTTLINAVSMSIKLKDVLSLSKLCYVESVELCTQYYALNSDEVANDGGIFENSTEYQGEGTVVAIIDNAFDTSHVELMDITSDNFSLIKSKIKDALYNLNSYDLSGVSAASLNLSNKIAYAYDYAEADLDLYDSVQDHGTHVMGIVNGVVPNAQLALLKVGDANGSMYNDTILAALEDCYALGVDVVNMSLGSLSGFSVNEDDALMTAVDNLKAIGTSVVCAAGNAYTSAYGGESGNEALSSNIDNAATSSPACYDSTYSVGNVSKYRWITSGTTKIAYSDMYYEKTSNFGNLYGLLGEETQKQIEYVALMSGDSLALGKAEDYTNVTVTGKIVVVSRGDNSFTDKLKNAENNGAAGILIVNTDDLDITAKIEDKNETIPCAILNKKYGDVLISNAEKGVGDAYYGTLSLDENYYSYSISASSSKGVVDDLSLGVDFVTYGTKVYSYGLNQSYQYMSGTSMASPNATGVIALLKQYVKANAEIFGIDSTNAVQVSSLVSRLAMSNTELLKDINEVFYSPRSQGAGILDLLAATSTKLYITTYDSQSLAMDKTTIELGDNIAKNKTFTLNFEITNCNSTELTFDVTVDTLTELLVSNKMSGLDKKLTAAIKSVSVGGVVATTSIVMPAATSKTVSIEIELSDDDLVYLNNFENGIYLEGYVQLKCSTLGFDTITISTPFIGFYGDWDDAEMLDITAYEKAEGEDAAIRASTSYGVYGSYYIPMGEFAYKVSSKYDGEAPTSNSEYAALSIYSSAMYELGYIQLGLLRNAEYMTYELVDNLSGEIVWSSDDSFVGKTQYVASLGRLYGGDIFEDISPYSLSLINNNKYTLVVNIYRTYDEESDTNEISDSYTQDFYVDYETPTIDNVTYKTENNHIFATLTLSDNHYLQALAVCKAAKKTSSPTNVTLDVLDVYPVTTEADGTGKTRQIVIDVTDALQNSTNGYIYYYAVDYAFNYSIYYDSVTKGGGTISGNTDTSGSNTNPTPSTDLTSSSISFVSSIIEINVNEEKELANLTNLTGYLDTDTYTWISSNSDVCVISEDGKITGLSTGTCSISVTNNNGKTATTVVKVVNTQTIAGVTYESSKIAGTKMENSLSNDGNSLFDIDTSKTVIELAPGESFKFVYTSSPYNYNYIQSPLNIEVSSTNTDAVEIVNGVVVAKAQGESTITVVDKTSTETTLATYTIKVCSSLYINDNNVLLACFSDDTTLDLSSYTFVAIGKNAFTYAPNLESVVLPSTCKVLYSDAFANNSSIRTINLGGVKTIYSEAFKNCYCLSSIDLSNIEFIGESAFDGCANLTTVVFDQTKMQNITMYASAFENCPRLENFTIGGSQKSGIVIDGVLVLALNKNALNDSTITSLGNNSLVMYSDSELDLSNTSITRIEQSAFMSNTNITKIVLPKSIEYIGAYAFNNCTNLSIVTFDSETDAIEIGDFAFSGTLISTIDLAGIETKFGQYVLSNCPKLIYADLGIVKEMGTYTFAASTALTTAIFDDGSVVMGEHCFSLCIINDVTYALTALSSISIPATITEISNYAFAGCTNVDFSTIDFTNITSIGMNAFYQCEATTLIFPLVNTVAYGAFANSTITGIKVGTNLTSGTLVLDELAFYQCSELTTVVLPTSTNVSVEIGKGAFYECEKLYQNMSSSMLGMQVTTIFDRVISIGDYAFTRCESLTKANMPNVKSIGYGAFAECTALTSAAINSIESIGEYAFYSTALTSIAIPNTVNTIGDNAFADTNLIIQAYQDQDYNMSNICFDVITDSVSSNQYIVLYSKLSNNSLKLVCYPSSCQNTSYSVLNGTSYIGANSFVNNEYLTTVNLGDDIAYIGHGAFYNCSKLSSIRITAETVPTLLASHNDNASELYCNFVSYKSSASNLVLYVNTTGIQTAYKNNYLWSDYFDYILVYTSEANVSNIDSFLAAVANIPSALNSNFSTAVSEAITVYDTLTTEEKAALATDTASSTALTKYNNAVTLYNYNNEDDDPANGNNSILGSDDETYDLPVWAVIIFGALIAAFVLFVTVMVTTYIAKQVFIRKNASSSANNSQFIHDNKDNNNENV